MMENSLHTMYFLLMIYENKSNMNCGNEMKMKKWSSQFISDLFSYIINTHFFHGNIWTHNWPTPNVSGFIAQLVEHRTIARSRVQTPLKSWIFSGSFTLLHKLHSLRRSFLHFQCIFWSFWCDRVNLNSCTHQERTKEDEGNEVNVSERAATCARWIHHPGITHCTALTR